MRVLAIDTALEACSAAVLDTEAGGMLAQESQEIARGHAEALVPLIARVLDQAALPFAHIDRIAVTVGPGSFTGLRVGIAAARGLALAAGKPAIGLSTLAAYAAPFIAADDRLPVVCAIDARHSHAYLQVFGPGGRTIVSPRIVSLRDAVRVSATGTPRLAGTAAAMLADAWPQGERPPTAIELRRAPDIDWVARLGAAASESSQPPKPLYLRAPDAQPQDAAQLPPPMSNFFSRLFGRAAPMLSEASVRDAAAIAALHGQSFQRGWSDGEVEGLLRERAVLAHRATFGRRLAGFIMSRIAAGEAEILSVAVARACQGRGLAAQLLDLHLRRLAGLGVEAVFLEVGEDNAPANSLYARAGFHEVSRRENYYAAAGGQRRAALVLRRDLV